MPGKLIRQSHFGHNCDRHINRILLADLFSKMKFLIDTGADISVIPVDFLKHTVMNEGLVLYAENDLKV